MDVEKSLKDYLFKQNTKLTGFFLEASHKKYCEKITQGVAIYALQYCSSI